MMKKIIHLFFPVIMLSLFSCHDTEAKHEMEEPDFDGFVKISLQSQITGVQPMTGIVLWADNAKRNTDAISLEYSYMQYKDIVKEKGVYDWTPLEQILDAVASRKHQAIIRFWYTYPGYESAVPQYIRELPDYEETVALSEGKRTGFPDWRHPELQRFHKEFYQKFAERYDNDPRLAFLQTGFGLWAEYHIYDGPRIMGQTFPSKEFQAEFFRFMSETFKSTPWSVSIDAASSEYTPLEADASLRNLKFGVFDDSFMHETHDEYNGKNWKILGEKRYQTSPAGGEFGYYTKYDQEHVLDYPDGIHGRNFEGESKRFHITAQWSKTECIHCIFQTPAVHTFDLSSCREDDLSCFYFASGFNRAICFDHTSKSDMRARTYNGIMIYNRAAVHQCRAFDLCICIHYRSLHNKAAWLQSHTRTYHS